MSMPLKKRPFKGPPTLPQKVARLERKVRRTTPDVQTYEFTQQLSGAAAGYNEYWINALGASVVGDFSGDFFLESIHVRGDVVTDGGLRNALRVDVIVPQAGQIPTPPLLTGVQNYADPKSYKTYISKSLVLNNGSPDAVLDLTKRLGLVVKSDGTIVSRNNAYIVVRWYNTNTTAPAVDITWQVFAREK